MYTPGPPMRVATWVLGFRQNEQFAMAVFVAVMGSSRRQEEPYNVSGDT
jgi:hypothetical protein